MDLELIAASEAVEQPKNAQLSAMETVSSNLPEGQQNVPCERPRRAPASEGMNQLAAYDSSSDESTSEEETKQEAVELESKSV
jgi:hypothetical protein